ncbi:MAG: heavy-metal-associated domain-containing protein [Bacteroidota bacterium]
MKKLLIAGSLLLGLALIIPTKINAQGCCPKTGTTSCHKTGQTTTQTKCVTGMAKDSLKVMGKCGMCKTRIENAAKSVKGVTDAQWNDSKNMLVYYTNSPVKKEAVSEAVIKVGHDTELGKASDAVYNQLPGCCRYRQ